jgi:DHA1 family bicyclomycin/chloramphenicol resistance-like MFS transporter
MIVGAACASLSGIGANPALSTGLVLVATGVLAQASFWFAQRARNPVLQH